MGILLQFQAHILNCVLPCEEYNDLLRAIAAY